jgi:hypothetical protein
MATTTPNYGWTVPTSTDLVKDGATAIETLGDAIDASMNTALGTKKAGMVLLNTTSFSAVSSVSLAASTFTATYDNYRIVFNHDSSGGAVGLNMRMRAAGTDNTSANYVFASGSATQAGTFVGGSVGTGALDTSWTLLPISGTYSSTTIMDVFLPFSSAYQTNFASTSFYFDSLSNYRAGLNNGSTSVTTSYDSLTLYVASGTMTGAYSVYGYNK